MKVMKKLMILIILLTVVMSCELFDAAEWEEARKEISNKPHHDSHRYHTSYPLDSWMVLTWSYWRRF